MLELALAVFELLGATSFAFRSRQAAAAPLFVASWVASLAFALFGFIVAGPIAVAVRAFHPAVTVSVVFATILSLLVAAVLAGARPGFSLRVPAVLSYAATFALAAHAFVYLSLGGV